MLPLSKLVHVLAVGLWFGTSVFFTFVVGLSLSHTFEKLSVDEPHPYWFPAVPQLEKMEKKPPSAAFPDPLTKEQGSRIFGAAVGPMFLPYYALQIGCGVLAILTGAMWFGRGGVHKTRLFVLGMALAGAGAGWWLEGKVEELREQRREISDQVLLNPNRSAGTEDHTADAIRAEFGRWHTYSLFVNFATIACVTVTMGMAAFLPNRT
jgi:glycerol-3-phosphate acyltransferase PlsY